MYLFIVSFFLILSIVLETDLLHTHLVRIVARNIFGFGACHHPKFVEILVIER
jgi:hypothetical protein